MDTGPIYELRERLRAAAMAGTSLLSEDFRLKRALEAFKPMEAASPVFAKVGQLTEQLIAPDCPNPQGALLDAITLADAVICTLGTVDVAGEIDFDKIINVEANAGSLIVNAPYSTLKELLEALTTSGGGHYGYVCDTHEKHPELFRDYRVKHTLIQALDASYSELADQVEQWLIEDDDKTILPALYQDFDPKGKREMVRRVKVIGALAGAEANDFYVKMLGEAQKDVRTELIDALRYEPRNLSLLFDLSKTEKGKNKDKVFELLAAVQEGELFTAVQEEEVREFFKDLAKKKPEYVLKCLKNSTTEWSAGLVAGLCEKLFEKLDTVDSASDKEKRELSDRLQDIVRAIFGKGGTQICACYKKLLTQKNTINALVKETEQKTKNTYYTYNVLQYGVLTSSGFWRKEGGLDIEAALGMVLHHSLIVNPDSDLQALAMELYQDGDSVKKNIKFLSAAATVKFLDDENCAEWLDKQITKTDIPFAKKLSKERLSAVIDAMNHISWDSKKNGYQFHGSYVDVYYTDYKSVERAVRLPHAKEMIHWLLKQDGSNAIDQILAQLVPLNDEAMCKEVGEYFYKKAFGIKDNYRYQLVYRMKNCGWTVCKGLGVNAVKNDPSISAGVLYRWLITLPGDKEAIMEEMRTICSMVKSGELKATKLKLKELEGYMNEWYNEY